MVEILGTDYTHGLIQLVFFWFLDSTIVFCGGVISSTSSYIIIKTQFCYWCWNNNKFSCANSNWMVEFVNVADLHCERKFIQNFCASCSCAGVQNKVLNIDESIYIPVTRAEYTVLISAFNVQPLSLSQLQASEIEGFC